MTLFQAVECLMTLGIWPYYEVTDHSAFDKLPLKRGPPITLKLAVPMMLSALKAADIFIEVTLNPTKSFDLP